MMRLFVTRRHIPEAAIRIEREWGLKEMIADPNEVAEGVRAGANHVCDALLAAFAVSLKPL
jgi:hypothetical protein